MCNPAGNVFLNKDEKITDFFEPYKRKTDASYILGNLFDALLINSVTVFSLVLSEYSEYSGSFADRIA